MSNNNKQDRIAKIIAEIRKQPKNLSTNISNELGMIGEKVVVDWLTSSNYSSIHFGYHGWASYLPLYDDWEDFLTSEEKERVLSLFDELRGIKYRRPDFLTRMPELTFLEVKVNKFEMPKKQKAFLVLAKKYGFETKMACIKIEIGPISLRNYFVK